MLHKALLEPLRALIRLLKVSLREMNRMVDLASVMIPELLLLRVPIYGMYLKEKRIALFWGGEGEVAVEGNLGTGGMQGLFGPAALPRPSRLCPKALLKN